MILEIDYRTAMSEHKTIRVADDGTGGRGVSDMPPRRVGHALDLVPNTATITDIRFDARADPGDGPLGGDDE